MWKSIHNRQKTMKEYMGTYDIKESDTFRPTEEKRIHIGSNVSTTMTCRSDSCGIIEKDAAENGKVYKGTHTQHNLRIRKLTPNECMRLMAFEKKDTESMREIGMTDGQIYHCAGDSIVSSCLIAIFGEMIGIDTEKVLNNYAEKLAKEK